MSIDGVQCVATKIKWDMDDAIVACRQLKIPGLLHENSCIRMYFVHHTTHFYIANNVIPIRNFGGGTGPIFLGNVGCTGMENSLFDCPHDTTHDCTHKQDAGVICDSMYIVCM